MESTQNPFTPPQAGPKKSNKLKIIIAVLVLAIIGGAGYFFIQSDSDIFQGKMKLKTQKKVEDIPILGSPANTGSGSSQSYNAMTRFDVTLDPMSPNGSFSQGPNTVLAKFNVCVNGYSVLVRSMKFQAVDGESEGNSRYLPPQFTANANNVPFYLKDRDSNNVLATANMDTDNYIDFALNVSSSFSPNQCKNFDIVVNTMDLLIDRVGLDQAIKVIFNSISRPGPYVLGSNLPLSGGVLIY